MEIMNDRFKILTLISHDKGLLLLLSCVILSGIILLIVAITAGIWYL
jgi:hypothetical protein